nr:sigma-70 family RNA polymerase sigma factor [Beutenbergia cavernae]
MREDWARLLALLVGQFRRFDVAEDALAEAFVAAARTWPRDGVPASPAAWLRTAARRRALDQLRGEALARRKEPLVVVDAELRERAARETDPGGHIPDERLRLVFSCAHPALPPEGRVALTLRFVAGLPVDEIARLFLVQTTTMAARITRAKKKVAAAGIPFEVPPPERLAERLDVVAAVLYLAFTAGYSPGTGPQLVRSDVAGEAIRLVRMLDELLPGRPVIRALLALMLLQHSRRDARVGPDGELVLLDDQDRSRWHHDEIDEGLELAASLPPQNGQAEEYRLQALVAAEHARAHAAEATDWSAIHGHYARLEALTGSPVVRLARAVALAEADGPEAGLVLLDGLDADLPHHHRLAATRAELLARAGRPTEALAQYDVAIAQCGNDAERAHLEARRAEAAGRAR